MNTANNHELNSVAIVGLSIRCPGANNYREFWDNLCNGKESISFYTIDELEKAGVRAEFLNNPKYVRASGELTGIDMFAAEFFGFPPREAELMDPQHRIFLECAYEALEDAGYCFEKYKGKTGVYAGEGMNTYLLFNVFPSIEEKVLSSGSLEVGIGNDKDSLSTLVAYKLDLKGPALTIQSSSSTSLSSVCVACQSLLNYQCDTAIAGGVAVGAFLKNGYMYEEGGIVSSDGHCRPFDTGAHGLVPSNGAGVVVLKRLEDALNDNDNIYAVIKGFALNNDGAKKVNYSAPSVEGQAEIIISAQAFANVLPDTISYMEAHGTGTYIGDPIEIAALKKAFNYGTDKKSFCAIGSVKANIGHLDSAAGVAGLIKTALSLKYKQIPPLINFEHANYKIDFVDSPFYINSELSNWPENKHHARRAGVTSIGMGGTNAHVVLEEYSDTSTGQSNTSEYIIPFSAKTESATRKMVDNLVDYMIANPEVSLADIAYTMQIGRKEYMYRAAIILENSNDIAKLKQTANEITVYNYNEEKKHLFFIYGRRNNILSDEYKNHYVYRREIEECIELYYQVIEELDIQNPDMMTTIPKCVDSFIDEYCISKFLISLGIVPEEIFITENGLHTALCVADVLSIKDMLYILMSEETAAAIDLNEVGFHLPRIKINIMEGYELKQHLPFVTTINSSRLLQENCSFLSFDNYVEQNNCLVCHIGQSNLSELICAFWFRGCKVNWDALYYGEKRRKVSLPTYPFERKRYWIEMKQNDISENDIRKIDKKELSDYTQEDIINSIQNIWRNVLGIANPDLNDNFFEVGGDSRKLVTLFSSIDKVFPDAMRMTDLFAYPSIYQISEVILQKYKKGKIIDSQSKSNINSDININDIAVIGIAVKMPSANNVEEFWDNLINGKECIREFPDIRKSDGDMLLQYTYLKDNEIQYDKGGYIERVDYFDNDFFKISPKEANAMEPCQRMFLETVYESIEDAGYNINDLAGSAIGIYLGYVGYPLYGLIVNQIEPPTELMSLSANLTAAIPSRVSHIFDFKGPALLIDTACSSSLVALHQACESLKNGDCDIAIAGGVNLRILPVKGDQNSVRLNIMDAKDHKTKSFNNHSDGTVWGEGVAAVIVKPLNKAVEDRDNIYAIIKATVVNQDGKSIGMSAPNTLAQTDMLISAWDKAGISANSLSYIETHGSGTPLGDSIEIDAIRRAFFKHTDKRQFCAIGSVKTNIGHTDAVSGLAGLVKVILSLKNNVVPPSLHFENPNRLASFETSPVYFNDKALLLNDEKPIRCGVSSFGLSGTNAHAILEQKRDFLSSIQTKERQQYIFVLSAKNTVALIRNIKKYVSFLCRFHDSFYDLCFTASVGRAHYEYRTAIIIKNAAQLIEKLNYILNYGLNSYHEHHIFYSHEENHNNANSLLNNFGDENDTTICKRYVAGHNIDWDKIYPAGNRISIPTYSFERKRCWLEIPHEIQGRIKLKNHMFYHPVWQMKKLKNEGTKKGSIIFIGDENRAEVLFKASDYKVFLVEIGNQYKVSDRLIEIRNIEEDYVNLLLYLKSKNIDKIIHALNCDENRIDDIQTAVFSLYYLNKAFMKADFKNAITDNFEIVILMENAISIEQGNHMLLPEKAMVYGLAKTLNLENNYLNCRCINIQKDTSETIILNEIATPDDEFMVAYIGAQRYVERIGWADVEGNANSMKVRKNGVYVIAGGMGSIGLETAKYLCSLGKINIILINRTVYPSRDEWKIISKQQGELGEKFKSILEIERIGSNVEVISCDIANEKHMDETMRYIEECYGKINGIVNSAGVNIAKSGALLADENEKNIMDGIKAKVFGTKILEKYAKQYDVDFYVIFTSPITITSGIGMGIYTIANTFINAFVKSSDFEKITAIGWAPWEKTVKLLGDNFKEDRQLYKVLSINDMQKALALCVHSAYKLLMVGKINIGSTMFLHNDKNFAFKFKEDIASALSIVSNCKEKIKKKYQNSSKKEIVITGRENEAYSTTELKIGKIVGNILGYDQIDIRDNFYELGGDSIHALKAVNQINKEMNVRMDLSDLLKHPTVFEIAQILKEKTVLFNDIKDDTFTKNKSSYETSSSQNRLLILNDLEPRNTIYNITVAKEIRGNLDIGKLNNAFKSMLKRHDVFRTSFHFEKDRYIQTVHLVVDFELIVENGTEEHKDEMIKNFIQPFDLAEPPLIRALLIVFPEKDKYLLVYDIHHIITDGLSMSIFESELLALYYDNPLSDVKKQYKDYVFYQINARKTEKYQQDKAYWLNLLAGVLPSLNMPIDYVRPPIQSHDGNKIRFEFDVMLTQKLRDIAKMTKTTMYMILVTIYNILLYKYTEQEDIIIGTPVSGRSHFGYENTIGFFANTIVLRNYPKAQKYVYDFLGEIKNNCIQAFKHQDYPFDELVGGLKIDRNLSRNPLFDAFFALQNFEQMKNEKNELDISPYIINNYGSKFDISVEAVDIGDKIIFDLEYCSSLFSIDTMQQFSSRFIQIAFEFTQIEENRQIIINDLQLISCEEIYQINNIFNRYEKQFEFEFVIDLIEKQAILNPQAIAITHQSESLTYYQLCRRMNQVLFVLQENGLSKGAIVAILMEPSLESVVCILAVLKLGAAYMPLDPTFPRKRIEYMLEDSGCDIIISDDNVSFGNRHNIVINKDTKLNKLNSADYDVPSAISQEDLAYIMYTSGSLGKPKGVMVDHKALASFIRAITKEIDFNSNTIILSITTMSFDISILEIIVPLCNGSKVVLSNSMERSDLNLFYNLLHNEKVNMLQMTPSRLHLLLQSCETDIFRYVNCMLIGGEAFPLDLLQKLKSIYKGKIYNLYGPTEATIWCTCKNLTEANDITIGKPLCNTAIYIMNKNNEVQPIGIPGELFIKGDGLSRGYLNKPQLTGKSFIQTSPISGEVLYKTGDIAKWLNNGEIEMLGRIDHQIKIKGYRIELDEINSCVMQFMNIQTCVTTVKQNKNNDSILCSYFISNNSIDINKLRNHIAAFLPYYMVPQFICRIKELPVNQNGKLDYSGLPDPIQQEENCLPESQIENKMVKIFKSILKEEDINIKKSFFELGGNSLDATNLVFKIQQEFNIKIPLIEIFKLQNVYNIAGYIEAHSAEESWGKLPKAEPLDLYPTTMGQADIYWHERMHEGNTSYNMPMVLKVNKKINIETMESILKVLQKRHDALQIEFVEKDGRVYQRINRNAEISIEKIKSKPGRENYSIYSCITPFNLYQAPLFKLIFMETEGNNDYLIFDMHHIITDGLSMEILLSEFMMLYDNQRLPEKSTMFVDFAVFNDQLLRSNSIIKQQDNYWGKVFETEYNPICIPPDYDNKHDNDYEGRCISWQPEAQIYYGLCNLCSELHSTINILLLSALNLLLYKLTNTNDIVIGIPVAGRYHPDTEKIVGMFVNTLPLRNKLEKEKTIKQFINEVKENLINAIDNQNYPINKKMATKMHGKPLYNILYSFQKSSIRCINQSSLGCEIYDLTGKQSKFYMEFDMVDNDDYIVVNVEYRVGIYKKGTIVNILNDYKKILKALPKSYELTIENFCQQIEKQFDSTHKDDDAIDVIFKF